MTAFRALSAPLILLAFTLRFLEDLTEFRPPVLLFGAIALSLTAAVVGVLFWSLDRTMNAKAEPRDAPPMPTECS